MAALSKHAILCIAAYALVHRRRRRRRNAQPQRVGRVWIKPHIGRHDEQGAYENLVEELRHDPAELEKFHRVNPATFDFLLAKVDGVISRQNTTYRASISAVSGSAMCVSYASRKCFTVIGLWPVGWCDRCLWPAHSMQQLLDRFVFRIGPTTVAFVKSTGDNCLWCAHTMQQSSFRRLCVQQTTKIAWCVPGFTRHLEDRHPGQCSAQVFKRAGCHLKRAL